MRRASCLVSPVVRPGRSRHFNDAELRARAVTASRQGVSVMAAVLSAEDSRRMFGADINKTGVQSVWIELQNQTPEPLWLLRPGSDPDYFSPLEVAWSVHTPLCAGSERTHRRGVRQTRIQEPHPSG